MFYGITPTATRRRSHASAIISTKHKQLRLSQTFLVLAQLFYLGHNERSMKAKSFLFALAVFLTAALAPSPAIPAADLAQVSTEESMTNLPAASTRAFVHPGLLHNEEDFQRMRTHLEQEPWKGGWERLIANRHASLNYRPRPVEMVVRGRDRLATAPAARPWLAIALGAKDWSL